VFSGTSGVSSNVKNNTGHVSLAARAHAPERRGLLPTVRFAVFTLRDPEEERPMRAKKLSLNPRRWPWSRSRRRRRPTRNAAPCSRRRCPCSHAASCVCASGPYYCAQAGSPPIRATTPSTPTAPGRRRRSRFAWTEAAPATIRGGGTCHRRCGLIHCLRPK
jgi:hypothetical protein